MIPSIDAQLIISYMLVLHRKPLEVIIFQFQVIFSIASTSKLAIAQLCNELQVCNNYFTMLQLTQKKLNNICKQNTVSVILFKL